MFDVFGHQTVSKLFAHNHLLNLLKMLLFLYSANKERSSTQLVTLG